MTYRQLADRTRQTLMSRYPEGEARWMVWIAMEAVTGINRVDLLIKGDEEVSDYRALQMENVAARLLKGQPLQYILGFETFMGMRLKVTPAVLIPRPETAELVQRIVDDYGQRADLRVLDIATGSGCIALALARQLKFAHIEALDISDEALAVARENAATLKAKVDFRHDDILNLEPRNDAYDLIVSNPPYVLESEKATMDNNVLNHEPHSALFVPDDDPLRFYIPIVRYAETALVPGGSLWFETNPLTTAPLAKALKDSSRWDEIEIGLDSSRCQRYITAYKTKA